MKIFTWFMVFFSGLFCLFDNTQAKFFDKVEYLPNNIVKVSLPENQEILLGADGIISSSVRNAWKLGSEFHEELFNLARSVGFNPSLEYSLEKMGESLEALEKNFKVTINLLDRMEHLERLEKLQNQCFKYFVAIVIAALFFRPLIKWVKEKNDKKPLKERCKVTFDALKGKLFGKEKAGHLSP